MQERQVKEKLLVKKNMKAKKTAGKQKVEGHVRKENENHSLVKPFNEIKIVINNIIGSIKNVKQKDKMLFWFFVAILLSTALKYIFVFYHTDYQNYLNSDMGGYWERALERYNGEVRTINQWVIWPPLYHIIMDEVFKVLAFFGLLDYKLEFIIGLNIILSSLSAIYLYFITLRLTKKHTIAFCAAIFYTCSYYSFYFNAFILSENLAVPVLIAAIYYLFLNKNWTYVISGVLLAIATGVRPGYGLIGLPFALYALLSNSNSFNKDWKHSIFFSGLWKATLVTISFFSIIFFIIVENNYISEGRLKGLASSSGLNYYFSFTKSYEVRCEFDGYVYMIYPPGSVTSPENGKLLTTTPIYEGKYFIDLANHFIKEHPAILIQKLADIKELYFGTLFPSTSSALWFDILINPFRWLFFVLSLIVVFSCFTHPFSRVDKNKYLILLSVILCSLIVCYFFSTEHRYIYAYIFAVYVIAIETIFEVVPNFKKYRKKLIIFISVLLGLFLIKLGITQVERWTMAKNVNVTIINNPHITESSPHVMTGDTTKLQVDAINFPFEYDFTHNTLGNLGYKNNFFVNFEGSFKVLQKGWYKFFMYSLDTLEFFIDQGTILYRAKPDRDEKEFIPFTFLNEGDHYFKLSYFHYGCAESGIRVMYAPDFLQMDKKYFMGESSQFIKFNKFNLSK
ncbi:MAG: glycosyltransferase family 39 protein [Bacteroidota bacterium]